VKINEMGEGRAAESRCDAKGGALKKAAAKRDRKQGTQCMPGRRESK